MLLTSSISPSYADCPLPLLAPSSLPLTLLSPPVGKSPGRTVTLSTLPAAPSLSALLQIYGFSVVPSFRLSSAVYLDVFRRRDAKGPLRPSVSRKLVPLPPPEPPPKLPSCCPPSFRPALQPISEGSPIDKTLPHFAPFSLFVRDLSFWAPLFDSRHRSRWHVALLQGGSIYDVHTTGEAGRG